MTSFDTIITVLQQAVQAINRLQQTCSKAFPQTVGTATSATAGAQTLPANPAGFLVVTLPSGATAKVPYYNS